VAALGFGQNLHWGDQDTEGLGFKETDRVEFGSSILPYPSPEFTYGPNQFIKG